MRRSPMAGRRTPLTAVTPLRRTAGPVRTPMARRAPQRTTQEAEARRLVALRSLGICEGCGRHAAQDWAHRIARSQMGRWCPSNGLHLCARGGCHDRAHASPVWAREMGWILRSGSDPATEPVWLAAHGWVLLALDGSMTSAPTRETA
jgi:hypothetical protein